MVAMQTWVDGTVAALNRQQQNAVTPSPELAQLRFDNERLRAELEALRARIHELETQVVEALPEDLVTLSRAAEIMKVNPSTITRWVQGGHFEMRDIGGRKYPMIVKSSLHRPARKQRRRKS